MSADLLQIRFVYCLLIVPVNCYLYPGYSIPLGACQHRFASRSFGTRGLDQGIMIYQLCFAGALRTLLVTHDAERSIVGSVFTCAHPLKYASS